MSTPAFLCGTWPQHGACRPHFNWVNGSGDRLAYYRKSAALRRAEDPPKSNSSVSPLHADHAGPPPLLIQAGTGELLAPDAKALAASAVAAGVEVTYTRWPGMWHDFPLHPGILAAAGRQRGETGRLVRRRGHSGPLKRQLSGPDARHRPRRSGSSRPALLASWASPAGMSLASRINHHVDNLTIDRAQGHHDAASFANADELAPSGAARDSERRVRSGREPPVRCTVRRRGRGVRGCRAICPAWHGA
jgi:hypothetical protein